MKRRIRWHHGAGMRWMVERALRPHLLHRGSLTARLQALCTSHRIGVSVLREGRYPVGPDEACVLGLRGGERARVREVCLACGDQAWVFAHSVIPARTLTGRGRRLARLGHNPLGTVLFTDPETRRGPIELARVPAGGMPYVGFAALDRGVRPVTCWGRRSLFYVCGRPLLVCEFFLPALVERLRQGEEAAYERK